MNSVGATYRVPRQVLVYLFRRERELVEFLLLKRTAGYGGFWQGVTGAPERGETDAQGALREVREETGFSVEATLRPIDFRYELRCHNDAERATWERLYGAEVEAVPEEVYVAEVPWGIDPRLAPAEHEAFAWCQFDRAATRLAWEDNRRALQAALTFITGRREGQ